MKENSESPVTEQATANVAVNENESTVNNTNEKEMTTDNESPVTEQAAANVAVSESEATVNNTNDSTMTQGEQSPVTNNVNNEATPECQTANGCEAEGLFTENKVYSLSDYHKNIVLEIIESNRKVDSQIQDKLKSCEEHGMQVPAILVDSWVVRAAGYKCNPVIGTSDERKPHYSLLEGHNRLQAYLLALEKAKDDPNYKVFDYCFIYKRFDDPKKFRDSYRAINMSNVPTRTKDYVRDLLATGENKVLSSYQDKLKRQITAKAAGYATVNREIMKRDINAIFKDGTPDYIADDSILNFTTPVYEAVLRAFGCEEERMIPILKGTIIWKFNSDKFRVTDDKKTVSDKLVKLYNGLSSASTANILNAKKTTKMTKEQVIVDILEKEYKRLNENE